MLLVGVSAAAGALIGPDRIQFPDEWDPRLLEFVEFVEDTRGLEFEHPVQVNFMEVATYEAAARGDEELPDGAEEAAQEELGLYRALGLVEGEVDMLDADQSLMESGTLAYFDTEEKIVNVRGTELTIDVQATIVHELVHALQDQHFDIDEGFEFGDPEMYRALVEGDATTVEEAWIDDLSEADRTSYEEATRAAADEAEGQLDEAGVPSVLPALFGSYYELGTPLVDMIIARRGYGGLDAILSDPPMTSAALVSPLRYFEGDDDAPEVEFAPEVVLDDVQNLDSAPLGSVWSFIVLSARLDPARVLDVVDRVTDDWFEMLIDDEGRVCAELSWASRDGDADVVSEALSEWVDSMPKEADAQLTSSSNEWMVTTCDPGAKADLGVDEETGDEVVLPIVRSYLMSDGVSAGETPADAFCVADYVATDVPIEFWLDDSVDESDNSVEEAFGEADEQC